MTQYERTGIIEKAMLEIRQRMKNYDIKEGKHGYLTNDKYLMVIDETCKKYSLPKHTIKMIIRGSV